MPSQPNWTTLPRIPSPVLFHLGLAPREIWLRFGMRKWNHSLATAWVPGTVAACPRCHRPAESQCWHRAIQEGYASLDPTASSVSTILGPGMCEHRWRMQLRMPWWGSEASNSQPGPSLSLFCPTPHPALLDAAGLQGLQDHKETDVTALHKLFQQLTQLCKV